MANWVRNDLYIRGPKADIGAFRKQAMGVWWESYEKDKMRLRRGKAAADGRTPLSFQNFIPLAVNARDRRNAKRNSTRDCVDDPEIYAAFRLWGVKWDACEVFLLNDKPVRLLYTFMTPWDPPRLWLRKVSRKYPRLHFSMHFWTENDERGIVRMKGGKKPLALSKATGPGKTVVA